jgi:hypothetical protein
MPGRIIMQKGLKNLLLAVVDFIDNGNPKKLNSCPEGERIRTVYFRQSSLLKDLEAVPAAIKLLSIAGIAMLNENKLIRLN